MAPNDGRKRKARKRGPTSGRQRSPGGGPRRVAPPGTQAQGTLPTFERRSPLLAPVPSPSEEVMFDLHQRLGAGRVWDSLEELNREMRELTAKGPVPRSQPAEPSARAQRLVYDAWNKPEEGEALAEQALTLDPECVDALLFLALAHAERPEKAMQFAFQALEAGEALLERDPEAAEEGHLWGHLTARPYLRARAFLARYMWGLGGRIMATTLADGTLELDDGDALGLRYVLLSWYLDMGEEILTRQLLDTYKDEGSAFMLWADALLTFWDRGDDRTAKARLNKALKANRLVAELLLGDPEDLVVADIDSYAPGSEEEARLCAHLFYSAWERDLAALAWLDEDTARRPG